MRLSIALCGTYAIPCLLQLNINAQGPGLGKPILVYKKWCTTHRFPSYRTWQKNNRYLNRREEIWAWLIISSSRSDFQNYKVQWWVNQWWLTSGHGHLFINPVLSQLNLIKELHTTHIHGALIETQGANHQPIDINMKSFSATSTTRSNNLSSSTLSNGLPKISGTSILGRIQTLTKRKILYVREGLGFPASTVNRDFGGK